MKIGKIESTSVQQVQIVCLDLTDVHAMEQLSKKRDIEEYSPLYMNGHRFLLPPSVDRFLYSPEAIEDLQKQVQTHLIEDAHIRIIQHQLLCPTADGVQVCFVPLHVTRSFRYHGLRITGSYFVSLLHNVVATLPESDWSAPWADDLREIRYPLSPQNRQALIEHYMSAYLKGASSCTDFTFIEIPSKAAALREKSPTHRAFTNLAVPCADNNECVIPRGGSDMYIFAHHTNKVNAVEQVQELLSDPQLLHKLAAFGWSPRISEKLRNIIYTEGQTPEFNSLYTLQVCTVLEWVRTTWKTVFLNK